MTLPNKNLTFRQISLIILIGLISLIPYFNAPAALAQTTTTGGFIFGSENGEFIVKEKNTGQVRMRIDTQGNFIAQQQSATGTSSNFVFNGGFEQDMDKYVTANSTQLNPFQNRISDGWEQNYMVDTANAGLCGTSTTPYCEYIIDSTNVKAGSKALTVRATAANYTASVASMAYPVEPGATYKGEFAYRCDANIANFKVQVIFFAGDNKLIWNNPGWTKSDGTTEPATTNAYRGRSGTAVSIYDGACTTAATYTTVGPIDVQVPSNCTSNTVTGINDGVTTGTVGCRMATVLIQNATTSKLYIDEVKLGSNIAAASSSPLTAANVSSGQFGSNPNVGGGNYSFPANVGIGTTLPAARLDIAGVTSTISNTAGDINILPAANLILSQGSFGIGSSTPLNKLHVQGTANGSAGIYISDAIPSATSYTLYNNAGTLTWNGVALATGSSVSGTTGYLSKFTASNALGDSVIYETGTNIGIGTAVPAQKLDVVGTVKATAFEGAIPAGLVSFFNLASCPTGWTELIAARGMYIVGLPLSGTLAGTAGTALSNLENRAVGQHNHTITDAGHTHSYNTTVECGGGDAVFHRSNAACSSLGALSSSSSTTGISIANAGSVAGTNAPYIQLLACQKS